MSVANDFDPIAEERRKELARALIRKAMRALLDLRLKSTSLEQGDQATWQETRFFAQELIREAAPLELPLLVACAKEVLAFTEKKFAGEPLFPDLVLYTISALDTVAMELERLRHDRDLR
jgi:hypothetical protein